MWNEYFTVFKMMLQDRFLIVSITSNSKMFTDMKTIPYPNSTDSKVMKILDPRMKCLVQ